MKKHIATVLTMLIAAGSVSAQQSAAPSPGDPVYLSTQYLITAINDSKKLNDTVSALRAAKDKELLPLWAALAKSADKNKRLMATIIMTDISGPEATAVLLDRAINEQIPSIKGEAVLKLIEMKAITPEQLANIIEKTPHDENVQMIAARELAAMGQGKLAEPTLKNLIKSNEPLIKGMARLSLLGIKVDPNDQVANLRSMLMDISTDPRVLGIFLQQIATDKIADALPMADYIAHLDPQTAKSENGQKPPSFPDWLKNQAFITLSEMNAPNVATSIQQEIQKATLLTYKIQLLTTLAARSDAQAALQTLTNDKDESISALAKFELARSQGGKTAADAASAAMAIGHPIVIDYVLDKIRQEYETPGKKVDHYAPALVKMINSVPQTPKLTQEHLRAAGAATILADIGSQDAMTAIKQFLEADYSSTQRAVCAGLMHTTNPAVCDLARPLLKSTYHEIAQDAALILGTFGDKDAEDALFQIIVRPQNNSDALNAVASLLLLRMYKQTAPAMQEIAKQIK